jgi:hypothetical protein
MCLTPGTPPVLSVRQGEEFTAEGTGLRTNGVLRENPALLQPADMAPYTDRQPFWYNPVCGPIYVWKEQRRVMCSPSGSGDLGLTSGSVATVPRAHHFAGLRGWRKSTSRIPDVIRNERRTANSTTANITNGGRRSRFSGPWPLRLI